VKLVAKVVVALVWGLVSSYPINPPKLIHALGSLCSTTTCRFSIRRVAGLRRLPRGSHGESMQYPASELRRITLPRTPLNKGDRNAGVLDPGPVAYCQRSLSQR
jgi:hypothetical protein